MIGPGLYVHVPFCRRRCRYCSFDAEAGREAEIGRYMAAAVREAKRRLAGLPWAPLASVFFGGGTPSLLAPDHVAAVLNAVRLKPGLREDAEVTLEANPSSVDAHGLAAYRRAGVNRLSIGMQSFDDEDLRWLGRLHTAAEGRQAFALARSAGFQRINLDLMYGLPESSRAAWDRTLETAIALEAEHVSMYALTVEPGTPLAWDIERGMVHSAEEEAVAAAYEHGVRRLADAGYARYEVSNFARPGCRCRHNWACWLGGEYLGVGASAHSFIGGSRSWNGSDVDGYVAAMESGRSFQAGGEIIEGSTALRERVWLQLRTRVGIALAPGEIDRLRRSHRLKALVDAGFLRPPGARLKLGGRGWLVADALAVEITELLEREGAASGSEGAGACFMESFRCRA